MSPCVQHPRQPLPEGGLVLQFALPDRLHPPAGCLQRCAVADVPLPIPADLGQPVVAVDLRNARAAGAVVAVPEAAVDEDHQPAPGHDDVRFAGQILAVKAVADAERRQQAANGLLRSGVAVLDPAHHGGALRRIEDVRHGRVASGQRPSRAVPVRIAAPS